MKSAMVIRNISVASVLLPRTAKLTSVTLRAPGRKSSPANFMGFHGKSDATIVPVKTATIPNAGSSRIPMMGAIIPAAVMVPLIPIS